ncbi:hypothetical protein QAA18_02475 [Luteimonas sp. 8-5]|uniref:phage integrase central domain-containing protein n=1 Tax=Luteimonas sp. 8-5 TaxID=3039387 RepID=UPI0024365EFC|nr:hypothetical protein [Luteimonas sp. 8-5]MDG6347614.1 hypothetical protein [Luteimonas sp. 8-5]
MAKLKARTAADASFKNVAEEWLDVRAKGWTKKQLDKERARLKNHAYPWIGRLPIADIGVIEIRPLLLRLVKRDCIEQAYRLREQLSRIFRFAVATERPNGIRHTICAIRCQQMLVSCAGAGCLQFAQ